MYKAYIGINKNWSGGINIPQIEDIKGSRNNWVETGTFEGNITPFCIWHWGIVGDNKV